MMTVVVVLAGLASAQAATGIDQKSGAAVSPAGKTLLQGTVTGGGTCQPARAAMGATSLVSCR